MTEEEIKADIEINLRRQHQQMERWQRDTDRMKKRMRMNGIYLGLLGCLWIGLMIVFSLGVTP